MTPEEIASFKPFLGRIPLFKDLSASDFDKVAAMLKPLSLPKGAVLFQQGDAADAFYVITSGQMQLRAERGGRTHVIGFRSRSDTVGETALLSASRAFSAVLDTTCEFLVSRRPTSRPPWPKPGAAAQLPLALGPPVPGGAPGPRQAPATAPSSPRLRLGDDDRAAFAGALALSLAEQTRKRVILVELDPKAGATAKSLGLPGVPLDEDDLLGRDLRDPRVLADVLERHPSGLGVLSVAPATLSGRLYNGLFLLYNLLRDNSDYVLIAARGAGGEVERTALAEADQWVLAASDGTLTEFIQRRAELEAFTPAPKRTLEVWLGAAAPGELVLSSGREWTRWPGPGLRRGGARRRRGLAAAHARAGEQAGAPLRAPAGGPALGTGRRSATP